MSSFVRRFFLAVLGMTISLSGALGDSGTTDRARKLVEGYISAIRPLEIAASRAWWDANISGKDEDFKRKEEAQNKIDAFLSDKKAFAQVKALKEGSQIDDPIVKRAVDVIYLAYLEKQLDGELLKKMTALANAVEKKFSTFRAKVDGKETTDADVRKILKTSTNSARRQEVYEASKEVGKVVEPELRELVKLRNQAAKNLGFANYHAMMLHLSEQNGADLIKLFDRLDELTREPFLKAKAEIDSALAKQSKVKVEELMPWHYHDPFFQEAPSVFAVDLDKIYAGQDLIALCRDFYRGIDLPIDLVIEKSNNDFAPKKGKNPHAFCTDITRDGTDVRVLANVVNNEYWMATMLHEFGHSVYSSINIPEKLPYALRTEAHILTTEGVAMMFEKLSKRRAWLEQMGVKVDDPAAFDETAAKMLRNRLLIFSRWCQVMLRFEKGMYEDPEQDLNKLWWDMVEKYQMLRRPPGRNAPDYGSKIHICVAPVYYHNYMMGELFASQVHHAIAREVYKGAHPESVVYVGNKEVGRFMRDKVFNPGRTLTWNELTRHATGADLSPEAFAKDFQGDAGSVKGGLSKQEADQGFVSLFDGKTLAGWKGATAGYTAESGMLVCQKKGGGNLFTDKEYGDFVFRFEFKLEPGGNNGVSVRGHEIQILDDYAPGHKNLQPCQYHGSIYCKVPAKRGHTKQPGEWNTQEIECRGSQWKVTVNGVVVVDADISKVKGLEEIAKRVKGPIGFLGHGTRLEFRNLRIKELGAKEAEGKALFDGKTLAGWKAADYFGAGKVHVKEGAIVMEKGKGLMTGITYTRGDFPRMDYEVTLEGKKIAGRDFFCTTTFPVGESFCSLVVGGWSGPVVGLSSIDLMDASENETRKDMEFKKEQWYRVRIRVSQKKIEAWIDRAKVVDLDTTDRRISTRIECDVCKPFGFATYETTGAVRDIRVRPLSQAEKKAIVGASK